MKNPQLIKNIKLQIYNTEQKGRITNKVNKKAKIKMVIFII